MNETNDEPQTCHTWKTEPKTCHTCQSDMRHDDPDNTPEIFQFLHDRYNETQTIACHSGGGHWRYSEYHSDTTIVRNDNDEEPLILEEWVMQREEAQHIMLHDPANVITDIRAKRELVESHENSYAEDYVRKCSGCYRTVPCETLRILARPYKDHPNYQNDWIEN